MPDACSEWGTPERFLHPNRDCASKMASERPLMTHSLLPDVNDQMCHLLD